MTDKTYGSTVTVRSAYIKNEPCRLYYSRYAADGSVAVRLEDAETHEPIAKLSVCMIGCPPPEGYFWAKGYAENLGLPEALEEAGMIALANPERCQIAGYELVELYKITDPAYTAPAPVPAEVLES